MNFIAWSLKKCDWHGSGQIVRCGKSDALNYSQTIYCTSQDSQNDRATRHGRWELEQGPTRVKLETWTSQNSSCCVRLLHLSYMFPSGCSFRSPGLVKSENSGSENIANGQSVNYGLVRHKSGCCTGGKGVLNGLQGRWTSHLIIG